MTSIDAHKIPPDKREAYVRLHLQNAARDLGYIDGSQEESDFITLETHNIMLKGHPMQITVTAEQLLHIQGGQ